MTKLGYARVSSRQQGSSLAAQKSLLEEAGCSVIRSESVSGGSRAGQSELQTLLDFVREGDELCVVKLDRLGRQTSGILAIVDELRAKKASLRVLQPPLSTDDPITGQMMIAILTVITRASRSTACRLFPRSPSVSTGAYSKDQRSSPHRHF